MSFGHFKPFGFVLHGRSGGLPALPSGFAYGQFPPAGYHWDFVIDDTDGSRVIDDVTGEFVVDLVAD